MSTNIILSGVVGSYAFGLATEDSDVDLMQVVLDPPESYIGLHSSTKASQKIGEEEDKTVYEFRDFVKLCLKSSPNTIPLLFLDEYITINDIGKELVSLRECFISKKLIHTFYSMGDSQLQLALKNNQQNIGEKRKTLIDKYGYDTKAAAHTIRSFASALQLAMTLKYENKLPNEISCIILEYKKGQNNKDKFLETANNLKELVNQRMFIYYNDVRLRDSPDTETVERFVVKTLHKHINATI
jgi:predicted nucleotidyltransferase